MSVEAPERDPHADRHYIEIRCRGTVEALALDADRLVVGRHRSNGVVLDDKAVSRVHAVLERSNGVWFICDLGSHNGTFVRQTNSAGASVIPRRSDSAWRDTDHLLRPGSRG